MSDVKHTNPGKFHLTLKQAEALLCLEQGRHHLCNLSTVRQLASRGLAEWSGDAASTGYNRVVRWTAKLTPMGREAVADIWAKRKS